MRALVDLGPTKLLADEEERLRAAADALFFCESADDNGAVEALSAARATIEHLVSSGRWTEETAAALAEDLSACGPAALVA
jgi:hypothetical protein